MINDDIAARIAAKAARDEAALLIPDDGPATLAEDATLYHVGFNEYAIARGGHIVTTLNFSPAELLAHLVTPGLPHETPTLPWLQPATVDPEWVREARNHIAATREPFTHPLWDVSAA